MNNRGKLIELLESAFTDGVRECDTYVECKDCPNYGQGRVCRVPFAVDYLMSHGVTVQGVSNET